MILPQKQALYLCLCIEVAYAVSDNVEVITSCWLIALQNKQIFKEVTLIMLSILLQSVIYKVIKEQKAFFIPFIIQQQINEQIIQDFEVGQSFHLTQTDIAKGFDYTHYIKDYKNKDFVANPQLYEIISQIVKNLETEFQNDTQNEYQSTVPRIGIYGMNFKHMVVFPILGGAFLIQFGINAIRTLKTTPKKKK